MRESWQLYCRFKFSKERYMVTWHVALLILISLTSHFSFIISDILKLCIVLLLGKKNFVARELTTLDLINMLLIKL